MSKKKKIAATPQRFVQFRKWSCELKFARYGNDRHAIILMGTGNMIGEQIAVASVNLSDYPLPANRILIKNWSENEGILEVLQQAKIIGPVVDRVETGFVHADECELLVNPEDYK